MRQQKRGGTTIAAVGSMTAALAAQRALASAAIHSEVIKEDTSGHGCGCSIEFPSAQYGNARTILSAAHINVRRYESKP